MDMICWPSTKRLTPGRADAQAAELVKLRYFAGLTLPQAAETLGVSPRTADRLWAYAKAWLQARTRNNDLRSCFCESIYDVQISLARFLEKRRIAELSRTAVQAIPPAVSER